MSEMNNFELLNNDLFKSLLDDITEEEVEELGIEIEDNKFSILNDEQANFFLRRLEEIRSEKDKINNMCNNEIEKFTNKVNNFRTKELYSLENTEKYFISLLETYAKKQLENSNRKSIKLPFGTMSFKKGQRKIIYDDDVLKAYIKDNNLNQFIKIKEEINKADLKKAIKYEDNNSLSFNGNIVEGISYLPAEETFSIK